MENEKKAITSYESILMSITSQLREEIKESDLTTAKRSIIHADKKAFAELLILSGTLSLRKSGEVKEFKIFEHLKPAINELWLHATGQKYELNSSIGLCGGRGVGKTILLDAYCYLLQKAKGINGYRSISARTFHDLDNKKQYETGILHIEEFGKNPETVNNFGTRESPIINLLMERYKTREITFIDSNLTEESLGEIYGELLEDRFSQMINFIEVKGKSLRRN